MNASATQSVSGAAREATTTSEKGFVAALLLCFFLGPLGVHRFYAGKIGTGLLHLVTLGLFGLWTLVDFILIATGNFKDAEGLPIQSGG